MQDCKDLSGLQFMKFDLLTGGQEIKLAIPYEISVTFLAVIFFCLVHISLSLSLLAMVSSNFKIIK